MTLDLLASNINKLIRDLVKRHLLYVYAAIIQEGVVILGLLKWWDQLVSLIIDSGASRQK